MTRVLSGWLSLLVLAACSAAAIARADSKASGDRIAASGAATASPTVKPRFDCGTVSSAGQRLVCSDEGLARLDGETVRLYTLAKRGRYMIASRMPELERGQSALTDRVTACARTAPNAGTCAADAYVARIHDLRVSFSDARSQDGKGVSHGPRAMQCAGLDAGISVTFVTVTPNYARLEWLDKGVTLTGVPSGSGTQYQAIGIDGIYRLQTRGDEAALTMPGLREMRCSIGDIG